MKKLIKFPSIEQFRTVIAAINRQVNFIGLDENGQAIYDQSIPKPTLTFKGTCKLHGTNSGVSYNEIDGIWYQSRENIITPQKDNAGFAFFAESNKEAFIDLFNKVKEKENIDLTKNTISIFGEWCGSGIQKGVAISQIPKSIFIFGVKIAPFEIEGLEKQNPSYWVDSSYLKCIEKRIYNVNDFETYNIDIDFNVPQLSQNKLSDLTIEVEEQCPIGKSFGVEGIGEGIVWFCDYKGQRYIFKVKGEKHSKSKVKVLNKVDDEKISKALEIAEKVTPEWRLEQMLEQACDFINGGAIDRSKLADFIRFVIADVLKEELDIISEAGLEPKDINKYISDIARKYFFEQELVK